MKDYQEIPDFLKSVGSERCRHCGIFPANKEPINQKGAWAVLGLGVADGIYFVFETSQGKRYPIHISCMNGLRDVRDNIDLLKDSTKWWLVNENKGKVREYGNTIKRYPHIC